MEEFIKKHGRDIALAVVALYALSTGKKVNRIDAGCKKAFGKVDKHINDLLGFKEICYDNFGIIQTDFNKIATHVGYQGKLGVNE